MKQSTWWQYLLPQILLSSAAGKLANCQWKWFKNWAIKKFMWYYSVDLREAEIENYQAYLSFNAFFTRHLKKDARLISSESNTIVSPVDGKVSEIGLLQRGDILQAKRKYFSCESLLGDSRLASQFENGCFLTAYLAPKDYHRFHMPIHGRLREMRYIPGRLFSVNEASVEAVDRLFARNERVIAIFETNVGLFAYVLVGAMIVGSIAVNWHGVVNKGHTINRPQFWSYEDKNIELERGQECGYFQLGSTVILLFPSDTIEWNKALQAGTPLKMGQGLGQIKRSNS